MSIYENALYIQSGGPTSVINCSMAGVIRAVQDNRSIQCLYGARFGISGLLKNLLYDLTDLSQTDIELLRNTPSMSLGSCRYFLTDSDYDLIIKRLRDYNIRYLLVNGGNGTVKLCKRLQMEFLQKDYLCNIVMIPKTVDNDIPNIDFSPGFLSAANYVVISITELLMDLHNYDSDLIMVVEVMGRDSGWLTAASKVAQAGCYQPDLIYVPEKRIDIQKFIEDVRSVIEDNGKCMVVVSEGVKGIDGRYIFESSLGKNEKPILGMSGASLFLASLLRRVFSCKVRNIDLGILQRCAIHTAISMDKYYAECLGSYAVEQALQGADGVMVSNTLDNIFRVVNLSDVLGSSHNLPEKYITSSNNNICEEYCDLLSPWLDPVKPVYSIEYS